ncbi:hypothetical protein ACFQ1B_34690 [Streptomyces mexicanus]
MANPVVLVLLLAALAVAVAAYGLAVTLPRMLAAAARGVWRIFGAAPASGAPAGEPARPVYAVVTAPRDLRALWRETLAEQSRLLEGPERFVAGRLRGEADADDRRGGFGCVGVLLYPVVVASLVAVILVTAALCVVPVLLALLVWGLGCALWVPWWAVWAAVARAERALRHRPAPCPYPACGRTIRRPVPLCPACGARHRHLLPNRYGALVHRCRCGARLLTVGGGHRRALCCPHCVRALPARYDRARVVVLAGGADGAREAVHRRVLSGLGAPEDAQPPLVRGAGGPCCRTTRHRTPTTLRRTWTAWTRCATPTGCCWWWPIRPPTTPTCGPCTGPCTRWTPCRPAGARAAWRCCTGRRRPATTPPCATGSVATAAVTCCAPWTRAAPGCGASAARTTRRASPVRWPGWPGRTARCRRVGTCPRPSARGRPPARSGPGTGSPAARCCSPTPPASWCCRSCWSCWRRGSCPRTRCSARPAPTTPGAAR